jgi:hypothetical protein
MANNNNNNKKKKKKKLRIFGPKREEVAEGWRRTHNKELHYLYVSRNTVRVIK